MFPKQHLKVRAVGFLLYPFFCLIIENKFSNGSWHNRLVIKKNVFCGYFSVISQSSDSYNSSNAVEVQTIPENHGGVLVFLFLRLILTRFLNNEIAFLKFENTCEFFTLIGRLFGLLSKRFLLLPESNKSFTVIKKFAVLIAVVDFNWPVATQVLIEAATDLLNNKLYSQLTGHFLK